MILILLYKCEFGCLVKVFLEKNLKGVNYQEIGIKHERPPEKGI
jgi:hypothetical protein